MASSKVSKSKEIALLQKELNAPENIPPCGFRRNVAVYQLVGYVNNITGCYISENMQPIPVFIERARDFIADNPADENTGYYDLVLKYLEAVESYLSDFSKTTNQ